MYMSLGEIVCGETGKKKLRREKRAIVTSLQRSLIRVWRITWQR